MTGHSGINPLLVHKYNQPVPRYTSYPTVPFWNNEISVQQWQEHFTSQFAEQNAANGISVYVHLPFCESLCTYCGCNKMITANHSVEEAYLQAIEHEWKQYRKLMGQTPVLREIHLGGGTPTFFSALNLRRLVTMLTKNSIVHPNHEFSIEGHPNNTTRGQLNTLFALGFRRVSYGVQDLDPKVQFVINRIQPLEHVQRAVDNARNAGFTSVNVDLIYGLPFQTIQSIEHTIEKVVNLLPERIAFYSYAHVPWASRAQRLFDEHDLPNAMDKMGLQISGANLLQGRGYHNIGMDHFCLARDSLYTAKQNEKLHRNFMGYTTQQSGILIGLGVSAISDLGSAFAQNEKVLHNYKTVVNSGSLPIKKGYFLNQEDIAFRQYIKDVACNGKTQFQAHHLPLLEQYSFPFLNSLAQDGLLTYNTRELSLTETGHYFIRNVCSAFDLFLQRKSNIPLHQRFSKAI